MFVWIMGSCGLKSVFEMPTADGLQEPTRFKTPRYVGTAYMSCVPCPVTGPTSTSWCHKVCKEMQHDERYGYGIP